jgi:hypothetical protein
MGKRLVSYMGGAKFAIEGPNFNHEPESNQVIFTGKWRGVNNERF